MLSAQIPSSTVPESNGLKIMQDQAGHRYGSTTAIYTAVSDEYRNRLLTRVLRDQHGDDLYPHEATS